MNRWNDGISLHTFLKDSLRLHNLPSSFLSLSLFLPLFPSKPIIHFAIFCSLSFTCYAFLLFSLYVWQSACPLFSGNIYEKVFVDRGGVTAFHCNCMVTCWWQQNNTSTLSSLLPSLCVCDRWVSGSLCVGLCGCLCGCLNNFKTVLFDTEVSCDPTVDSGSASVQVVIEFHHFTFCCLHHDLHQKSLHLQK